MNPIITLTLNPSVDKTIHVDKIRSGADLRVKSVRQVNGGKGVNMARALTALGIAVETITLKDIFPLVEIRVNTAVVEPSGKTMRFLEPGPYLSRKEWKVVESFVTARLQGIRGLALCGSLPPEAPVDLYARLTYAARRKGVDTVLDSSGIFLTEGVKSKPWCVKPNREEAEVLLGFKIRSVQAVRKALQMLAGYGMTRVLLSLGEDGLAGFDGRDMVLVKVPVIPQGLTLGCGDCALGGFWAAVLQGHSFSGALALAAAAGAANVGLDIPGQIVIKKVLVLRRKIRMEKI
jgi:fructose-1-phosphate kinase PfkB-like protein